MHKLFLVIFFLAISSLGLWAQKMEVIINYVTRAGDPNNILYKPGQLINWPDFQAKPVEASDAAAITNAGFGLNLAYRNQENAVELIIDVNCSFSKKKSWVKNKYRNDYILNHERRHFDIAYIHAAHFIQKLRKAKITANNYATLIEQLYNETADEMSKVQNDYDEQTNHSRISEKQLEWDGKIARQLDQVL